MSLLPAGAFSAAVREGVSGSRTAGPVKPSTEPEGESKSGSAFTYTIPGKNKSGSSIPSHGKSGVRVEIELDNGESYTDWIMDSRDVKLVLEGIEGGKITNFRIEAHHSPNEGGVLWGAGNDPGLSDADLAFSFDDLNVANGAVLTLNMCNSHNTAALISENLGIDRIGHTIHYTTGTNAVIPGTDWSFPSWATSIYTFVEYGGARGIEGNGTPGTITKRY